MGKKIIIVFIVAVILFTGIRYGQQKYSDYLYSRETVIAGPETEKIAIYIEPDDTATRAAANYLSFAMNQAFGKQTEIVTEPDEEFRGIRILCGTELPEPAQKAKIIYITVAEAADDDDGAVYTVRQEETAVSIFVPQREDCFGAVKAVADRWLQKDCGLESKDELRISQAMIDRQLLNLPTEITGELRILTQNLCYSDDGEGRTVEERARRFLRLVDEYRPDLIGVQECSGQWTLLLQEALGGRYTMYGRSLTGSASPDAGWDDAVFFRKDRFEFKDGETFWLSNTPSEAATKLNFSGPGRICTWALLEDRETERTLLFSNTHLHNGSRETIGEVREQQAEILLRRLRRGPNYLAQYPGFLTGDFNGGNDEPFYSRVTDYYEDSQNTAITNSSTVDYSYQNYGTVQALIDFCFHSPGNVTVLDYHILDDQYGGYVSDHYGILITAVLN